MYEPIRRQLCEIKSVGLSAVLSKLTARTMEAACSSHV
jgi:hypothetical protein